jgi:hypothetical protein
MADSVALTGEPNVPRIFFHIDQRRADDVGKGCSPATAAAERRVRFDELVSMAATERARSVGFIATKLWIGGP